MSHVHVKHEMPTGACGSAGSYLVPDSFRATVSLDRGELTLSGMFALNPKTAPCKVLPKFSKIP